MQKTPNNTELEVMPGRAGEAERGSRIFPTQYSWEGDVAPGTRLQFVTVLLPHAPMRDASELAGGITVLADRPGVAAVQITRENQSEIAVLNPQGTELELDAAPGSVSTDGRAAYLDFDGGNLRRVLVLQGTFLKIGSPEMFRRPERMDYEK